MEKLNLISLSSRKDRQQQPVKSTKNAQDISPQISRPPMKTNLIRTTARSRSATPYPKTIKKQTNRRKWKEVTLSPVEAPSQSRLNLMTWTVAPSSTQRWLQPLMRMRHLTLKLQNSSWMQFLSKWPCQDNNWSKKRKNQPLKPLNRAPWAVDSMISP